MRTLQRNMAEWHHWTDEEDEIIRVRYKGGRQSERDLAEQLSQRGNGLVTPAMVMHRVNRLGLRQVRYSPQMDKSWTPEEDEMIEELIQRMPIDRVASYLHRTPTAVRVRMTRRGISAKSRFGWYTKMDVAGILGVDHHIIGRWIDSGVLKAKWRIEGHEPKKGGMSEWQIEEKDLREFIKHHPAELTGRNVDLVAIIDILQNEGDNPLPPPQLANPRSEAGPYKIRQIGCHWDGKERVIIWLVNGRKVRRHLLQDFTMGGHHYRYPQIPEAEIWIDDHNYDERTPTIMHECDERKDMKFKKRSYVVGHNRANRTQRKFEKENEKWLHEGLAPRKTPVILSSSAG